MQKINDIVGLDKPALFTWLSPAQRDAAKADLEKMPLIKADDIDEPQKNYNNYKSAEFNYFERRKDTMAQTAAKMRYEKMENAYERMMAAEQPPWMSEQPASTLEQSTSMPEQPSWMSEQPAWMSQPSPYFTKPVMEPQPKKKTEKKKKTGFLKKLMPKFGKTQLNI